MLCMRKIQIPFLIFQLLSAGFVCVASSTSTNSNSKPATTSHASSVRQFNGLVTNGPAICTSYKVLTSLTLSNSNGVVSVPEGLARMTNRAIDHLFPGWRTPYASTNFEFDHFRPESLNNAVWTNLLARTNGRTTKVWSTRLHPPGWPTKPPEVRWATNGLLWGMKGMTALSPCWENEGGSGQVPITALTRRHGYTRGHQLGPEGFNKVMAGRKVWFVTVDNLLVQRTVVRDVGRTKPDMNGKHRDYTILLFNEDLPPSIEPMRVISYANLPVKYPPPVCGPWPIFQIEQGGSVSAGIPEFTLNTWKGGDSGSANMLPLPGELVFYSGRSTTGPDAGMQADMDELCRLQGLDPRRYQLQWADLSAYPSY